ncbi:MAG: hypothetical protein CBC55_03605 [Gammaproteobacteria bacterium TMED95]|nr:MAG: hypothetical protein CBC55_03605 [Gammaproteobacteria bacterium TMED95]|tara:strand:- start:4630 stop:5097 length:468 start_codon:yes stop_codon:yes gene_type:complete
MIVLYPFSSRSNTDLFLNHECDELTLMPVVRMMETLTHNQFNVVFKEYSVRERLVRNDYASRMEDGDCFYIPTRFGHIVCVGVSHETKEKDVATVFEVFQSAFGSKDIVIHKGFVESVPGTIHLVNCVSRMENGSAISDWNELLKRTKEEIDKGH